MQDTLPPCDFAAPGKTVWVGRETIAARSPRRDFQAAAAFGGVASLAAAVIGAGVLIKPPAASAIPAFARQTGQPCATCHTIFPELTPFGRRFKLGGYTMGGGLTFEQAPPIAATLQPAFTHTGRNQDTPPIPETATNNNTILQQASLFYGGTIYGNLGAFIQGTHDRATDHTFLDNTDIRYAGTTKLLNFDVTYGVTANNNPTVQDVWNTTPAWGFPYISSTIAPQIAPPGTVIEGSLSGKIVGTGIYTFWNDMLYLEGSAYQNLSKQVLEALGEPGIGGTKSIRESVPYLRGGFAFPYGDSIGGAAPYWRAALEYNMGDHSFEVGTFGMAANVLPDRVPGFGFNQILDVGFDAQYQYIGDPHIVTAKITHINEQQHLNSSFLQGNASNAHNTLESFKGSISYIYDHTVSLTGGYFSVFGSADAKLFGASFNGSPDGQGLIFDLAYSPFMKGGPSLWPWANARIGLSYTHFLKLFGGVNNFDGRNHNAGDNDTLFAYVWTAF